MKATLLLAIVTVLVAGDHAAVIKTPSTKASLNVGEIGFGDRLLHRQFVSRPPVENTIQLEDVVFRGDNTIMVTAVMVTEVGDTNDSRVGIAFGGVGSNRVTVRIRSAVGKGYQYLFDVWGRTVAVPGNGEMTDQEEVTKRIETTDAKLSRTSD